MIMRYPCLGDITGLTVNTGTDNIFHMIKKCIHEIHDGDEVFSRIDMSEKELDAFLDSMSSKNFENLTTFFETMPKLLHEIEVKNPKTKKKNKIPIEGLQSFFE